MKRPRVPILVRILGLNALLVFMPVASFLSLDTYEKSLLEALEASLVQQGRFLAAWLGEGELTAARSEAVLAALGKRHTARLRVIDGSGALLADSSLLEVNPGGAPNPSERSNEKYRVSPEVPAASSQPAESDWIYRLLSLPVRLYRRFLAPPAEPLSSADFYAGARDFLEGPEIRAALAGYYGAATRISAGGQVSVTLYSALPVGKPGGEVRGVVLSSQSTYRILADLYRLRLEIGRIFLVSLAASSALSLLLWLTISRPLKRLGGQARSALSLSGLSAGHFDAGPVSDEVGDLALALREFSSRLGERLAWAEEFASDLAHEIRNPLASIRAAAELLDGAGPRESRELASRIARDVDRANRVVGGLRELSRIEAEADEPARADIRDCAQNCARRAESSPAARSKSLSVTVAAGRGGLPPTARIPPGRLAIALEALLDNAVSFSPEGAVVEIRMEAVEEADGPKVRLSVSDRGPGFPPEHLDRAFDRFFSFRPERSEGAGPIPAAGNIAERSSEHCGLGLAIVRGIVLRARGRAEAANREGGGARVTLILPAMPR